MSCFRGILRNAASKLQLSKYSRRYASGCGKSGGADLKKILHDKIVKERERIKSFRKEFGDTKIDEVTINKVYGGMRTLKTLVCETSVLDPQEGIRFRGLSIPEIVECLPKAKGGKQPLPEGIFWLLLTGDVPTKEQVKYLSKEWVKRSCLPEHVEDFLERVPCHIHPMSQFTVAITLLNSESKFLAAYNKGVKKTEYWDHTFEDSMDLIAKLPIIAAKIYRNSFKDRKVAEIDENKDWSENFSVMLGYDCDEFFELMRLYLTLHCDHEGGNVSAHTTHLVGSALSDPYLSFASGMNGLAGPLHGLASQEVLTFLENMHKEVGDSASDEKVKAFAEKILKSGNVIPGYGHAVLRKTDPRFVFFKKFADDHFPDDPLVKLAASMFKVVPPILQATGKVQNPWPNVDAHSGVLLQHYDLNEKTYYTVLFGVSRALGVLASLIWDRGLGQPIERPKSLSTDKYIQLACELKKGGGGDKKGKDNKCKPK